MSATLDCHGDARGVVTVVLNRPERLNAFDEVMIAELSEAFARIEQDQSARAVVLRGAGRAFCAGADLAWMRRTADYNALENLADAQRLAAMLHTLDRLRVPTVALIHGAAYGGGVGLAACCDIVIAVADARFCLSETRIGLTPATISPYVIAAIGARQARRYFLTAEVIDADHAHLLGLAHEVVAAEDLETRCESVLSALLAGKPGAQQDAKRLVFDVVHRPIGAALAALTSERIAHRRTTGEARDAMAAFLARRAVS